MMNFFKLRPIQAFVKSEKGVVTHEFVIAMLWLCWWYVAAFVFFDGYRQHIANIKATYTVGDLLSRQTDPIDEAFLNGLGDIYGYLINWRSESELRYTSIKWDDTNSRYEVHWSHSTGTLPELTTGDLPEMANKLPSLVDGEHLILVESRALFRTLFKVGLDQGLVFNNFVATSPRFAVRVECTCQAAPVPPVS